MSNRIHHQAVMIGARKTLVGVMTQPAEHEPEDRPVFVILNSGIIHRVGHHRMYVTLARALAGAGYQVLRFDLSGIGDSECRGDGLSPLEGVLADVREVVDWLVTTRRARKSSWLDCAQVRITRSSMGSPIPVFAGSCCLIRPFLRPAGTICATFCAI